jgi:hypothetical protein
VLATFTTDPGTTDDPSRPNPRSILETTQSINENFNRLLSYLAGDPATKSDTRKDGVPSWTQASADAVTGRPRHRPEYIKVLEFTEKGYPHLHVLFFDVPCRESDGMPWLCDKAELSQKWSDYGQGQIVDTYPLTFRDDLDELDAEFSNDTEAGFVDWYRYGDHGHSDDWVLDRLDDHERIKFSNDDENPKESTAGAYLGKYLSATFGSLMESASMEVPEDSYQDKTATWKLALYWATQRRFWSLSRDTRHAITPNEHCRESADVAKTVRWASVDTVERLAYQEALDPARLQDSTGCRAVPWSSLCRASLVASLSLRSLASGLPPGVPRFRAARSTWSARVESCARPSVPIPCAPLRGESSGASRRHPLARWIKQV